MDVVYNFIKTTYIYDNEGKNRTDRFEQLRNTSGPIFLKTGIGFKSTITFLTVLSKVKKHPPHPPHLYMIKRNVHI